MSNQQMKGHEKKDKDSAKHQPPKHSSKDQSKLADMNGEAKKPKK